MVSVIIVTYNCESVLLNCLESIFVNVKTVDFEVIIVDNNSIDNTVNLVRDNYPLVTIYALDQNWGFGKANNWGAIHAKGDYLFFLNPDTVLINNAIEKMLTYLDSHKKVGLCGAHLLTNELKENGSFSLSYPTVYSESCAVLCIPLKEYQRDISKSCKVAWVCGAAMLMSKAIFDENGRFDENFFMYYEEPDMSKRLEKNNLETHFVEDAMIIHLQGVSSSGRFSITSIENVNSQLRYLKKWNIGCFIIIFFLRMFKSILGQINAYIIGNEQKKKYWIKYYKTVRGVFTEKYIRTDTNV